MAEDIWIKMSTLCPYCKAIKEFPDRLSLPVTAWCYKCKKQFQIYYKPMAMKFPKAIASSSSPTKENKEE